MLIIIADVMQRYLHEDSAVRRLKKNGTALKDSRPPSQNSSGNAGIDLCMHLSLNSQLSLANCFEKNTEKYYPKFWKQEVSTSKNLRNCNLVAIRKRQVKLGKGSDSICSKNYTR